ncbi:hypothetical protein ACFL1B_02110 [Nanoarchaeota archaeon]
METELLVRLVIPDNVAITTLNTLKRMGYKIDELKRQDYYWFDCDESIADKIGKVDILVNANKNRFTVKQSSEKLGGTNILVTNIDEGDGLLNSLKTLGFNIKKMKKGTLWTIKPEDEKLAKQITEDLLMNPHYQEYEIL